MVRRGRKEIIQLLLNAGAEVNNRNRDKGTTALIEAAAIGYEDIVQILLERGADVNLSDC
jgi:uncharacterized protein